LIITPSRVLGKVLAGDQASQKSKQKGDVAAEK
jgi:hypothetical protein